MERRVTRSLIALVTAVALLLGARYQWARAHRTGRMAVSTAQRDSLRRDSTADEREPADTTCFASRLGLPCDQH